MVGRKKPLERQALIDLLDEEEIVQNFYILPPENGTKSDEDSGDEDGGQLDNLPGSILKQRIMTIKENVDIQVSEDIGDDKPSDDGTGSGDAHPSDDNVSPPKKLAKSGDKKKKAEPPRKWIKEDLKIPETDLSTENLLPPAVLEAGKEPLQLFSLFFDDEIINLITNETNRYSSEYKNKNLNVTHDEIRCFLGILILSRYKPLPRKKMYWENSDDCYCSLVANAMRRDRFCEIFTAIHFADNNSLNPADKYAKIRPLVEHMNNRFIRYAPNVTNHSFDESMVEYFGRHGCKQSIRNKPIRFGFKVFVGSTDKGYMVWVDPYQGAGTTGVPERGLGVGGDLVAHYANILMNNREMLYHLFIDNWFTSVKLMAYLKSIRVYGTGTLKANRVENCPLKPTADLKKDARGSFDYRISNDGILLVRWKDNNVVTVVSNAIPVYPLGNCMRYSSAAKGKIQVQQPRPIRLYNKSMGGVDLIDQNINAYRVAIRGKKWYSTIVTYFIDAAINNAWLLSRYQSEKPLDLLDFRRTITINLLKTYCNPVDNRAYRLSLRANADYRYDGRNHLLVPQENRTRCALCKKKSPSRCMKCDVGLHVACNLEYHTQ